MERITRKDIQAIIAALESGLRVELLMLKDGTIAIQTVQRKKLKI